jgi:hypothetical protein
MPDLIRDPEPEAKSLAALDPDFRQDDGQMRFARFTMAICSATVAAHSAKGELPP